MIELLPDLPANVLGLEAKGKVTREDYEKTILPQIEERQRHNPKVRLLYVLGDEFESYTPGAMWEDALLAFKRPTSWERIAVVTDAEWIRRSISLFSWMVPGEIKLFSNPEEEEAKQWVAAA